jgi:hypothetical protein
MSKAYKLTKTTGAIHVTVDEISYSVLLINARAACILPNAFGQVKRQCKLIACRDGINCRSEDRLLALALL